MKTLWITYAWKDNEEGEVDFIAQELELSGLSVKLDRWNIKTGQRLWEQIDRFISSPEESDGWLLVATEQSLSSEACKEEFSYALDRALHIRSGNFPIIALFLGTVDDSLLPSAIRVRLYVSITDVDWKERILSAVEGRPPDISRPKLEPYSIKVHEGHRSGKTIIEIRPRAGRWAPVFAGIPAEERSSVKPSIFVEPRGVITRTGIISGPAELLSRNGRFWIMTCNQSVTPNESLYIWVDKLPSEIRFGVRNGSPQFRHQF